MPARTSEAFVLATWPFREGDLIVSFLTRDLGKLRGVARRARRPKSGFGSGLERLSHISMSYFQRETSELVNLNSLDLLQSQFTLLSEPSAACVLDFFSEVTEQILPAAEPSEKFFRLLTAVLEHLHTPAPGAVWRAATYFSFWAVKLAGFLPDLDACLGCGSVLEEPERAWFMRQRSGLFCAHCRGALNLRNTWELTLESRAIAEEILRTPIAQLSPRSWQQSTAADLRRFLAQQMEAQIDRRLITVPVLGSRRMTPPTFQEIVLRLKQYWSDRGCIVQEPFDVEVGAGTMCPETFLRVLGPTPYRTAYVQPSRRPADGRYGDNPNRLYKHMQLQVILKPTPADVIEQYMGSLEAIGIDLRKHDLKLEEDNWESPTLGAWGVGWQVMLDGLEITQFTYFQQCGGIDLDLVPAEITYGLERLTAFLQGVDSVYDITWTPGVTYRDVRYKDELQYSVYNFEAANVATLWKLFDIHEGEARRLIDLYSEAKGREKARFPLLAAYDHVLKCSNLFNTLDARGAISVTERVGVIGRVRKLAVGVAEAWVDQSSSAVAVAEVAQ